MKKILFLRLGGIGDVLMTTPLIRQIRQKFPDAKIDYIVGKQSSCALKGNKNIDEIIEIDEKIFLSKNFFKWLGLIKKIRKRNYDVVFVLMKHWIFNLTAFLFKIKRRVGFNRFNLEGIFLTHKVPYNSFNHEIIYYLDLAKMIGLKVNYSDVSMDLFSGKSDEKFAERIFKRYKLVNKKVIGMAPAGCYNLQAGYDVARQWPIEKYSELAEKITGKDIFIILFGGKNDSYAGLDFDRLGNKKIINLIGKTTIQEAASLIRKCDYFICNDTGLMHISACVNKRTISLFGPTHPLKKAPLWKESKVIWKDSDIYDFNADLVGKYPNRIFMRKINVDDVLREIR